MSSAKWRPFCLGINVLTSRAETRIFRMNQANTMIPRILASSGNQKSLHWLHRIFVSMYHIRRDSSYMCDTCVQKRYKSFTVHVTTHEMHFHFKWKYIACVVPWNAGDNGYAMHTQPASCPASAYNVNYWYGVIYQSDHERLESINRQG